MGDAEETPLVVADAAAGVAVDLLVKLIVLVSKVMTGLMLVELYAAVVTNEIVAPGVTIVAISSRFSLAATDEDVALFAGYASVCALPSRVAKPSKVTRAFSEEQDKSAALNRARMFSAARGIEKFVRASDIRRGIADPKVTLFSALLEDADTKLVVVQPSAPAVVHLEPVKPLVHRHEQTPEMTTAVPPLLQVMLAWQDDKSL